MNDEKIKAALERLAEKVKLSHRMANNLMRPGLAEFVSDFNGQPYGSSRASLKGKRVMIQAVYLYADGSYSFSAFRTECGLPINAGFGPKDIKFLET